MAEMAEVEKVSGGQFMEDFISKRKCLHFHNIILQVCIFTLKKKKTLPYLIFSYNSPKSERLSHSVVSRCSPPGSSVHGLLQARITGVGSHPLLQGIFPTKRLSLGLLNCRQILYHLSHQGSPE